MTCEIQRSIKNRDYHLKKSRQTGSELHWSNYRRLRNTVTSLIKASNAKCHKKELQENINDPTAFWKYVKHFFPTKSKENVTSRSFIVRNNVTSNGFCKFFSEVGEKLLESIVTVENRVWQNYDCKCDEI